MKRAIILFFAVLTALPFGIFAQQGASALRDYVGLINQSYHPGMVAYFENVKKEYDKQGETDSVKAIDLLLKGAFGSGFLYVDRGNFYIITNHHVVAQAHTVSITFERSDETKTKIDNLRMIATDEDKDLAILAFPQGQRPLVTQGLAFLPRTVEEGETAYSAGFPGLGMTPIWQFGNGVISNASVRFPRSLNDETIMGPYIQHTAQVDDGNSGGPLLIALRTAPSGYAVAGVNTLSGTRRQAANYAVPISVLQPFISSALNPNPATYRAALDERLKKFTDGLTVNQAVFPHINKFLSSACVGENIEYAFEEMRNKAPRSVIRTFIEQSRENIIGAMGLAVAWTIETSIRGSGAIRAEIKEINGEGEEYTVIFSVNNKDVSSVWIREYGTWRIKSFGTVASGDHSLIQKRDKEKKVSENLRTDYDFLIEAGIATTFTKQASIMLYANIEFSSLFFNFYLAPDVFWAVGLGYCLNIPVVKGDFGIVPYIKLGAGYTNYMALSNSDYYNSTGAGIQTMLFGISLLGQVGVKITTSYVPGLYANLGFQYNLDMAAFLGLTIPYNIRLSFCVGYAY